MVSESNTNMVHLRILNVLFILNVKYITITTFLIKVLVLEYEYEYRV